MIRPIRSKELEQLEDMFKKDMKETGYRLYPDNNVWMPSLTADKRNHYRITAHRFLDPSSPAFAVYGSIGTDIHNVFYFQIKPPFDHIDERYRKMMEAMEPFLEKELSGEELRLEF